MPSLIFSEKKNNNTKTTKTPRNVFVISAVRSKAFLIYTAHKRINVRKTAFYLEAVKSLSIVPPKSDVNVGPQNFIEYFYALNFSFNADFQKNQC